VPRPVITTAVDAAVTEFVKDAFHDTEESALRFNVTGLAAVEEAVPVIVTDLPAGTTKVPPIVPDIPIVIGGLFTGITGGVVLFQKISAVPSNPIG